MKYCVCLVLIFVTFCWASCTRKPVKAFQALPFFTDVRGIQYTEVRRAFDNGLSFDTTGFQLEPAWRMKFLTDDTVRLYNPLADSSYKFHVHYDHDSVINMARVWLRVKTVSKDSLKFQLLQVEGRNVSAERSNIFMTFYADSYINNKLQTSAEELRKPKKNDSLFVRRKIKELVNRPNAAFAARTPVELSSKSKAVKVEKVEVKADFLSGQGLSEEYLAPEFNIVINPAYKDFNYSFTVTVDSQRQMHFGKSTVYIMPEFEETYNKVMKGIMEVYLQNLLEIQPGKTLGIAHSSEITVNVKGIGKE